MSDKGFNWVSARAECSIGPVFMRLYLGCADDAQERNRILANDESQTRRRHFSVIQNEAKNIFQVAEDTDPRSVVTFSLHTDRVEIKTPDKTLSVTLTIDAEGDCKLQVDGEQELSQWQVRKLVLESLFFGH
jgi:hypothetical protein